MSLKNRLLDDIKQAMRDRAKELLGVLRLASAAIKQREVDERIELDDTAVIATIEKMIKQRRESIVHFEQGRRPDLVAKEAAEIEILQAYMPEQLSEAELDALINDAIASTGASEMRDMGKVMGIIKSKAQGRTDMGVASAKIKTRLSSS